MKKITNARSKYAFFGLLVTTVVSVGYISLNNSYLEVEATGNIEVPITSVQYLSGGVIPLQVSGVVRAAEETIIYAQTAGIVASLPVREGSVVKAGDLLLNQTTPVADARLTLATAERSLSSLQQSQSAAVSEEIAVQTELKAYSTSEVASLRVAANASRIKEVSEELITVIDGGILTVIDVINYVNNNRTLFSAEGMSLYDQVVKELYGQIPNYFRGGVLRPYSLTEDIISLADEIKNNQEITVSEIRALSTLLDKQLEALSELLITGEDDVFDRQSTHSTSNVQEEYLTNRAVVISTQQELREVVTKLTVVMDEVIEDNLNQDTAVQVTALDKNISELQANFTNAIKVQSDKVAAASQAVAASERSLGKPTAPFAGTVARVHVDLGEYVQPNSPLLTLIGAGAREIVVRVPAYLLTEIALGQKFVVGEEIMGQVSRFSPVADGGSGEVVIALTTESEMTGVSLTGHLLVDVKEGVYNVPRKYIHFDADGPYIVYQNGQQSVVTIIYDSGKDLFVEVAQFEEQPILPAGSVAF